jgi:YD repeat-containing protein
MDPVKAEYSFHGVFLFGADQTVGSNRLIITTYPDGTGPRTFYDSLGHMVSRTDLKGRVGRSIHLVG